MNFSRMTVAGRLTSAFGVVLLVMLISAGFTLYKLAAIQANLEDMQRDNNVKIRLSNEMSQAVHVVVRVIRSQLLLADPAARAAEGEKIVKARRAYDDAWGALEKMPASEAGKAIRAKINAAGVASRPVNDRVLALNAEGKTAEAIDLLFKEANPLTSKWQDALEENGDLQQTSNHTQFEAAETDYLHTRNTLIGVNLLCVWHWPCFWAGGSRAPSPPSWVPSRLPPPVWPKAWPRAT